VTLVKHDHVIDAVSAQGSDEAFHEWILPRAVFISLMPI
jgi:hypothetical protein